MQRFSPFWCRAIQSNEIWGKKNTSHECETALNSQYSYICLFFCLFDFLSFYLFAFLTSCLLVFLSFCLFFFLSLRLDITPIKCLKGFKCQKSLFVSKFKSGTDPVTHSLTTDKYFPPMISHSFTFNVAISLEQMPGYL